MKNQVDLFLIEMRLTVSQSISDSCCSCGGTDYDDFRAASHGSLFRRCSEITTRSKSHPGRGEFSCWAADFPRATRAFELQLSFLPRILVFHSREKFRRPSPGLLTFQAFDTIMNNSFYKALIRTKSFRLRREIRITPAFFPEADARFINMANGTTRTRKISADYAQVVTDRRPTVCADEE
jgi:hypothetical protein